MARVAAAEPPSIRALDSLILFPQGQPFLLLVYLLFVLLLVYVSTFTQKARLNVSTFTQKAGRECFHFHPGKLPRITGTCG